MEKQNKIQKVVRVAGKSRHYAFLKPTTIDGILVSAVEVRTVQKNGQERYELDIVHAESGAITKNIYGMVARKGFWNDKKFLKVFNIEVET